MKNTLNSLKILGRTTALGTLLAMSFTAQAASKAAAAVDEATTAHGARRIGAGVILGDPTGVAVRGRWNRQNQANGYFEFIGKSITVGADFVWRFPGQKFLSPGYREQFAPYIGPGLFFGSVDHSSVRSAALGLRGMIGVEWDPLTVPAGFFFEMGPGFSVLGDNAPWGFFNIALGGVFYFE